MPMVTPCLVVQRALRRSRTGAYRIRGSQVSARSGRMGERGDRRVGHGHRADMAALDLRRHVEARGAGDGRARSPRRSAASQIEQCSPAATLRRISA